MKRHYIAIIACIFFIVGIINGSDTLDNRQVIVIRDKNTLSPFDSIKYRILIKESIQFKMSSVKHITRITQKESYKLPAIDQDWNKSNLGNITINEISNTEKELTLVFYMSLNDTVGFKRRTKNIPANDDDLIGKLMIEAEKTDSIPRLQSGIYCIGVQLDYVKEYTGRFNQYDKIFIDDTITVDNSKKTNEK